MAIWKIGGLAAAAVLGSGLLIGQASAMPANGLATVASHVSNDIQDVRWVCGPYRCWWSPGPYWGPRYYGYAGPRPYWGWRHGWRRWWS
jgi:hypothetical protein